MREVDKTKQVKLVMQAMLELREWCRKYGASLEARNVGEIVAKLGGFEGRVELEHVDAKFPTWVVRYED